MNNKLKLFNHNKKAFELVKKTFETENIVGIVHATGTGKSYIGLSLALDNKDKKIVYVVPSNSILEHINEIIEQNNLQSDLKHVEFRTYQSFVNMTEKELSELNLDMLILDEFHHIGAPIWGARINKIIETHKDLKVFGMSAYTIRDRGSINERDLANPKTNELFSNKIVSRYDLCDAIIDGILPKPTYKSAFIKLEDTLLKLEEKLEGKNKNSKDYIECKKILDSIKKRIHEAPEINELFKRNIKKTGKYIYFCPPNSINNINDIDTIIEEVKKWLYEMGLNENDFIIYKTTSEMEEEGKKNREAFYNDKDLNDNNFKNKLRIMFAINQYNEGVHAPNLDGVIMGRGTTSDIVYFEQLGRALNVSQKDDITSPLILDLTNNYDFIKELESNLKERVKELKTRNFNGRNNIELEDCNFDIEMINIDLFETLRYVIDRITITWEDRYDLAKKYYDKYKHSNIPSDFKTINGVDKDDNGINIGHWMRNQRISFHNDKLSDSRIKLLNLIEFDFTEVDHDKWNKMYDLAKKYYEHHKDLKIPSRFKTINGYEKDENGIDLGRWIRLQMYNYRKGILTDSRIKLLEKININFESNYAETEWNKMYDLAKKYYEYHKNLEIPASFKTKNGFLKDEEGVNLGMWIFNVRKRFDKLTPKQKKKLDLLNIRLDTFDYEEDWNQKYKLASEYYKHHKNLLIPTLYKTKNGYEPDNDGTSLGRWLMGQKNKFKKLPKEKQDKLLSIGFVLNVHEEEWLSNYKLACLYYGHHKNLMIKRDFKTNDGINYDENGKTLGTWIVTQRQNFENISKERKELLLKIGFVSSVKSNKNKIEETCALNNINISKNKDILTKISYQELLSKINYLKDNNIEVTINEKLHEIFSMSSPNMKVIYGITLEELIEKYYIKSKEKGV